MVLIAIIPIDIYKWPVFEKNAIVRLFLDMENHIRTSMSIPTIKHDNSRD